MCSSSGIASFAPFNLSTRCPPLPCKSSDPLPQDGDDQNSDESTSGEQEGGDGAPHTPKVGPNGYVVPSHRGVVYGLAKPLDNWDPVYANLNHLDRMTAASGSSVADRLWKLLLLVPQPRVHKPWRLATSWEELIPDVLDDWKKNSLVRSAQLQQLQDRGTGGVSLWHRLLVEVCILWDNLWELPPPIPPMYEDPSAADHEQEQEQEQQLAKGGDKDNDTDHSSSAVGWSSAGKKHVVLQLSHRDEEFLRGRTEREQPTLSPLRSVGVAIHFILALAASYLVIAHMGKAYSAGTRYLLAQGQLLSAADVAAAKGVSMHGPNITNALLLRDAAAGAGAEWYWAAAVRPAATAQVFLSDYLGGAYDGADLANPGSLVSAASVTLMCMTCVFALQLIKLHY